MELKIGLTITTKSCEVNRYSTVNQTQRLHKHYWCDVVPCTAAQVKVPRFGTSG